jgi:hypothetical protein
MEKFKKHIEYNLLNTLKLDVMDDESSEPFAFITDESREEFSNELINYIATILIDYDKYINVEDNATSLYELMKTNKIDLTSTDPLIIREKIKLALEHVISNS